MHSDPIAIDLRAASIAAQVTPKVRNLDDLKHVAVFEHDNHYLYAATDGFITVVVGTGNCKLLAPRTLREMLCRSEHVMSIPDTIVREAADYDRWFNFDWDVHTTDDECVLATPGRTFTGKFVPLFKLYYQAGFTQACDPQPTIVNFDAGLLQKVSAFVEAIGARHVTFYGNSDGAPNLGGFWHCQTNHASVLIQTFSKTAHLAMNTWNLRNLDKPSHTPTRYFI